ncbi:hypothetical protein CYMTET_30682, partial [Cymbomonas tetramitiformis]
VEAWVSALLSLTSPVIGANAVISASGISAGAAGVGAPLLGGGVPPPEAELLARALRDSVATAEGWDVAKCSQACADFVHEAAKLRLQLTLLKGIHPFGKLPMKALEANAFPAMVYALPELAEEECELDELPAGKEATQEHWRAFVHMLQARVSEFQMFVKSKLAALGSSFRTVNEDQLARALRGELAPEDIARPPEAEGALEAEAGAVVEPVAVAVAF